MCFIIDRKICPKALKAKKDIRVYKVLENVSKSSKQEVKGESPFKYYTWLSNKLEKRTFSFETLDEDRIEEGLHAFVNMKPIKVINDKGGWTTYCETFICEFFIPKGAKYYFNDEEIVSEEMIWSGRVWSNSSKRWVKFGSKIK